MVIHKWLMTDSWAIHDWFTVILEWFVNHLQLILKVICNGPQLIHGDLQMFLEWFTSDSQLVHSDSSGDLQEIHKWFTHDS